MSRLYGILLTTRFNFVQDGFIRFSDVEIIARGAYPELQFERALEIVKSMGRHSMPSFQGKITYPGYQHVPVSWILCENDAMITPTLQREYIQRIEEESQKKVTIYPLTTGHSPNITASDQLAKILVQIMAC